MEKPKSVIARDYLKFDDDVLGLETENPQRYILFYEIAGYRKYAIHKKLYRSTILVESDVLDKQDSKTVNQIIIRNPMFSLPYQIITRQSLLPNATWTRYDENGKIRMISVEIAGPTLPSGSIGLPDLLPVIHINFEGSKPELRVLKNMLSSEYYTNKHIHPTRVLTTVDKSRACFKSGDIVTKLAVDDQRLTMEITRPDGIQITTQVPLDIGVIDFEKITKPDPREWMKFPTSQFKRQHKIFGEDIYEAA